MTVQERENSYRFIGTPPQGENERKSRPMISVVAPAYNEELNLPEFYRRVSEELSRLEVDWEIIFVDDGSQDNSRQVLEDLHRLDERVKAILFARNFGNQLALSAGLAAVSGDAAIIMDSDLQHPPEVIPELIARWRDGFPVVHTVRDYGSKVSWSKKITSSLFYKVMNLLSGTRIEPAAPDFKLLDRKIVDLLNQMPERTPYFKALIPWLGFRQTSVRFTCKERFAGKTSFNYIRLGELAVNGIISFSTKPLRWIMYIGCFILACVVPYGVWAVFQYFVLGPKTPGWTSLILLNMLLGGATLVSLGIIGEYVGRIYNEVRRRPLYTVEKTFGLETSAETEETDESLSEPESAETKTERPRRRRKFGRQRAA